MISDNCLYGELKFLRANVVQFSNVVYSVTLKQPKPWWNPAKLKSNVKSPKGTKKEILHGVSGVARPGEMVVMLGPSGSGKTTLLKVLGGRLKSSKVEGTVLYNDEPHSKFIKRRTGFVTQDDVLFANLTVKETLVYAARLRLPDTYTRDQKVGTQILSSVMECSDSTEMFEISGSGIGLTVVCNLSIDQILSSAVEQGHRVSRLRVRESD